MRKRDDVKKERKRDDVKKERKRDDVKKERKRDDVKKEERKETETFVSVEEMRRGNEERKEREKREKRERKEREKREREKREILRSVTLAKQRLTRQQLEEETESDKQRKRENESEENGVQLGNVRKKTLERTSVGISLYAGKDGQCAFVLLLFSVVFALRCNSLGMHFRFRFLFRFHFHFSFHVLIVMSGLHPRSGAEVGLVGTAYHRTSAQKSSGERKALMEQQIELARIKAKHRQDALQQARQREPLLSSNKEQRLGKLAFTSACPMPFVFPSRILVFATQCIFFLLPILVFALQFSRGNKVLLF